jgi:NADH-quinone oxidoreductase subunit M
MPRALSKDVIRTVMANLTIVTIFVPLLGAGIIWAMGSFARVTARYIALATVMMTLLFAGYLTVNHDHLPEEHGFAWTDGTTTGLDIQFRVGLDGLSLWLFALSALLMLTCVLVSWEAIRDRSPAFYCLLLFLETGMLGVFAARDILLFYVFFEFTLIPLFFLIGIWGSENRRFAASKFFIYTLSGSLFTFLGLMTIVLWDFYHSGTGVMTFSISSLTAGLSEHPIQMTIPYLGLDLQMCVFIALFAGFAIKVPLFPLHTWLPLAHVQAPTAGSVLLAGVLLKIGTYGFLRFSIPMLPHATAAAAPWVLWLSVAGIIYGALVALAQSDIKRLIAYSSVSHLGFCMLGLFALNRTGMQGGALQMINHGLSTGGLFAVVGMMYERYHTREISNLAGLCVRLPILTFFMLLFTFSSIGLPGLNGFAGEFLILIGMFQHAWTGATAVDQPSLRIVAVLAVAGVVLGAWYMLWLVQRVFFGPLRVPVHDSHAPPIRDLAPREVFALAPLAVFVFWIGLQPGFFLEPMAPVLDRLAEPAIASSAQPIHTAAQGDSTPGQSFVKTNVQREAGASGPIASGAESKLLHNVSASPDSPAIATTLGDNRGAP